MKNLTFSDIKKLDKTKVYKLKLTLKSFSKQTKEVILYNNTLSKKVWGIEGSDLAYSYWLYRGIKAKFNSNHQLCLIRSVTDLKVFKNSNDIKSIENLGVSKKHKVKITNLNPYEVLLKGDFCEEGKNDVILKALRLKLGEEKINTILKKVTHAEAMDILSRDYSFFQEYLIRYDYETKEVLLPRKIIKGVSK